MSKVEIAFAVLIVVVFTFCMLVLASVSMCDANPPEPGGRCGVFGMMHRKS